MLHVLVMPVLFGSDCVMYQIHLMRLYVARGRLSAVVLGMSKDGTASEFLQDKEMQEL